MEQTKIYQLSVLGVGIFFLFICFFLNTEIFYLNTSGIKIKCTYSFSAKAECNYDGQISKLEVGDCQGDSYCNTFKATPVLGGLSLALGIIILGIFYFQDQLSGRFSKQYVKYGLLGLLLVAIILQMLIPILHLETKYSYVESVKLTLFFEFVTLVSYCTFGGWISYQQQRKESLLS